MSEEEQEAIAYYKEYKTIMHNEIVLTGHIKTLKVDYTKLEILLNYIDRLQEELKKRDKVINLMAFEITENTGSCPLDIYDWKNKKYGNCIDCNDTCKECFIEYFYKQTEEEDE